MSDSGPTTVGSIVGKVRMDRAQWLADKAATQKDAKELADLNPTIHVDADIASAMAKIEAVRAAYNSLGNARSDAGQPLAVSGGGDTARIESTTAAERRLAAAVSAADSAYARAALAQMRLTEVRDKAKSTDYQLAAAELAASEAVKRLDAANEKAIISEKALEEAQQKAARAALEKAAAEVAAAKGTDQASASNGRSISRMQLMGGAIGALIPLLAPLTGYVVGVAGGFAGMGAAGVLAIFGIRNEMQKGTTVGLTYSAGLQDLKGDFEGLAQTAAVGFLADFQTAQGIISDAMPTLNSQTAEYADLLGDGVVSATSAAVNGMQVLNPLFVDGAEYINALAAGIDEWTSNGGLQEFTDFARTELPIVADTLGQVATAAVTLTTKLAPTGNSMLELVGDAATLVTGLITLDDTIQQVSSSWTEAGGAFEGAPWLSDLVGVVGQVLNPFEMFNSTMDRATFLTGYFGGTLDTTTGKVTKVANAADVAKAALDRNSAAAGVSAAAYTTAEGSMDDMGSATEVATAKMYLQNDAAGLLKQQLDLLNGKAISAAAAQNQYDSQLANTKNVQDAATGAIDAGAQSLDKTTASGTAARGELLNLTDAAFLNAQALRDNGTSSEDARTKLIAMKEEIIANAVAHGQDEGAVRAYIDQIYQIPASVPPTKIEVDNQHAIDMINAMRAAIDAIPRYVGVTINTDNTVTYSDARNSAQDPNKAKGGTIGGLAAGGTGGSVVGAGNAFSDTAGLYHLANGEEVTSNMWGQADAFRPLLKAINAGRGDEAIAGIVRNSPQVQQAASSSRSSAPITVSLKGATLTVSIDGRQMTAFVQDQIVSAADDTAFAHAGGVGR